MGVSGSLLLRGSLLVIILPKANANLRHGMKFHSSFAFYNIVIRNHSSTPFSIPCSVPVRILGEETQDKMNYNHQILIYQSCRTVNTHTGRRAFKQISISLLFVKYALHVHVRF